MKLFSPKYFSVVLLIAIFVFKGVASLTPLLNFFGADQYELLVNTTGESKEKSLEDTKETKEFLSQFYNSQSSFKLFLVSNIHWETRAQFTQQVFLSITTPPPRIFIQA